MELKSLPRKVIKKAHIYRDICPMLNGRMKQKFYLVEHEIGKKLIIEEYHRGVVRYVPPQRVVNCLLTYIELFHKDDPKFAITNEEGYFAVKYWSATTDSIPVPHLIAQKTDTGLAFHRLPFDIDGATGETPTFDDFFSRCTNAMAIQAWIGSLFYEDSDRQQYIWIYGEGGDGKGTLTHTLEKVFGPAHCAPGIKEGNDKFWTYRLLGKRLATIPECQHYNFTNSAIFKQLTGGDAVNFEQKGQDAFTANPNVKFFFSSNERPNVNSARANERRIIYGEVKSPTENVSDLLPAAIIEGRMWDEAASFLNKCKQLYKTLCPSYGLIPARMEIFQELAESNEENLEAVFSTWFIPEKGKYVLSSKIKEIYKLERMSEIEVRNFQAFIKRRFKCQNGRTREKPQKRAWFGLRLKTDVEKASDIIEGNDEHEE